MTNREILHKLYFYAWAERENPQSDLARQIIAVITAHPEYEKFFNDPENYKQDPGDIFLHLSGHLSVLEQLTVDKPPGVRNIYQQLIKKHGPHPAEHVMMDVLFETLGAGKAAPEYMAKLSEVVADLG